MYAEIEICFAKNEAKSVKFIFRLFKFYYLRNYFFNEFSADKTFVLLPK